MSKIIMYPQESDFGTVKTSKALKRYFLSYRVISSDTPIQLEYTSLFAFAQALERTMDNRFVIEHSIEIRTEELVTA